MNLKKLNVTELSNNELKKTEGGAFWPVLAAAASAVALYEFGYQYAKRHLENAK